MFRWSAAVLLLTAVACDDGVRHLDVPAECNPLQGGACLAPWPASVYQQASAASPTGVVLAFPAGAVPANGDGLAFDPARLNGKRGYSPATQIVAHFGVALDGSNLAGVSTIAASVTPASPTVILDTTTGERVAHLAEVDANALADAPSRQALYLRPATRLAGGRRYLVAITSALRAADGSALARPPGFAALVDGATTDHAGLEALRPSYDDVFARLTAAGVATDDLLLAWEFTTAPDDDLRRDLLAARDAAAALQGAGGANLALHELMVEAAPYPGIAKRVTFYFDAPNVRDDAGLLRDGAGAPMVVGTSLARAVALVPSCATAADPAPITIFGHGFFGGIEETGGGYLASFATRHCRIILGADWRGMSTADVARSLLTMGNVDLAFGFGERIVQGMIDVEALVALAKTKIATQVLTDGSGASVADLGTSPEAELTFYGISQGHILGSTLFAIDPTMKRAALHVGGANWSLLFERSTNWARLGLPFKGSYPDPLTQALLQQILQMGLDVIDPIHWAPLAAAPTSDKQFLLHTSLGDAQVTNLASFLQARTMGLGLVGAVAAPPYGLTAAPASARSGLVIVDEHPTPLPPTSNLLNSADNSAHGNPRRRANLMDQIDDFLRDGTLVDACGGAPCDCAAGACGALVQ